MMQAAQKLCHTASSCILLPSMLPRCIQYGYLRDESKQEGRGMPTMPSFDLSGKVALVTGGSRGIGLGIGTALAGAGARVVLAARHLDEVEAAAQDLAQSGSQVIGIAANISKADEVEALVQATEAAFGPVDILVNNAATNVHFGPVLDADD